LRLEGTNVNEGKKILMESGFNFVVADTMKDAADKVVAAARAVEQAAQCHPERSEGSRIEELLIWQFWLMKKRA
jgi:hypothetical protein